MVKALETSPDPKTTDLIEPLKPSTLHPSKETRGLGSKVSLDAQLALLGLSGARSSPPKSGLRNQDSTDTHQNHNRESFCATKATVHEGQAVEILEEYGLKVEKLNRSGFRKLGT